MYIPVSLRDIDEETGEGLHAARDADLQREQHALRDTTSSALNHPSANYDSNAIGMVHLLSNFRALLTLSRTSH